MRWRYLKDAAGTPLLQHLQDFLDQGKLILGICNGFQLLVKLGVLPALGGVRFERQVSLGHNDSARYEDRWVHLLPNPESPCIFTKGLPMLAMPVRHGEGKLVPENEQCLRRLEAEQLIALQYVDPETGRPTQEYPLNPNGSILAVAGLSDPSGRRSGAHAPPRSLSSCDKSPCLDPWRVGSARNVAFCQCRAVLARSMTRRFSFTCKAWGSKSEHCGKLVG